MQLVVLRMLVYNRMDISRSILDNLMGRDRNLPKDSVHTRDHYSNSDVCKPFLICFCFNTLFPNTVYDQGPCNKRHDPYLKNMFDNDLNRGEYERVYIKECISWIERRLQEAEQKTKKNQNTIENKSSLMTERPRQVLDHILSIDKDIEEMMKKAAIFGQNGQIDDSSRCLQEVQRLRQRRKEVDLMGDNLLAVVKQQKICEICGAIQTINDTEKRIQMHLEGKIHQGFLKLRTEIDTLRIRLEILQAKLDKNKEKDNKGDKDNKEKEQKEKELQKEKEKQKEREREREREREKQKQKQRELERERQKALALVPPPQPITQQTYIPREVDKIIPERQRERQRDHRDRDDSHAKKKKKEHKHKEERRESRDKKRERQGDKDYDRYERSRSRDHKKEKKDKKKRERSGEKQHKRDRSREREREKRNY